MRQNNREADYPALTYGIANALARAVQTRQRFPAPDYFVSVECIPPLGDAIDTADFAYFVKVQRVQP